MTRYPAYKPSGFDWLGDIPEHWQVKRLRFLVQLNPSKREINSLPRDTEVSFLPMEAVGDDGSLDLELVRPIEAVEEGYTFFRDGDVGIAKITPCFENGKGSLFRSLTNTIGFGTTELTILRVTRDLRPEFLYYLTYSSVFRKPAQSWMYGAGGQKRVPDDYFRNFPVALPSVDEQVAIVAYLDHELADIHELIAAQESLIEMLHEKRTALISQVVTRGLNPDAPMRDSSIEWLGEIPAHWEVRRNKSLFFEVDHRSITGEEELLTVSHLTGVTPRSEKNVNMFMAETLEDYKLCQSGDLVINTMWGWMGAMGIARQVGAISPSYNVYRPRNPSSINPTYFDVLYRTPRHIAEIKRNSVGVWESRLRIYPEVFLSLFSPLPPHDEQAAIAEYIASATHQIDVLVNECYKTIDILHERRAALITAAVTGQIDVRSHVPIQP